MSRVRRRLRRIKAREPLSLGMGFIRRDGLTVELVNQYRHEKKVQLQDDDGHRFTILRTVLQDDYRVPVG